MRAELKNLISFTRGKRKSWDEELLKTEADIRKKRQKSQSTTKKSTKKTLEYIAIFILVLVAVVFLLE